MNSDVSIYLILVLLAIAFLCAVAFVITLVLLIRSRRLPVETTAEVQRLKAELEKCASIATAREENYNNRLQDKDEACQKMIAEKDRSCAASIAEKENACQKVLAEKNVALEQMETACRTALQEKEKACAATVEEKDAACQRVLAEKDAALQQKDDACQAALAEKDVACKKVLEEKDRALKQKEIACAMAIAEKEKSCAAAISEKDEACRKVLAEKDAALQQKDAACQAALVEKDVACKKVLEEKDRALQQKEIACTAAIAEKEKSCAAAISEKDEACRKVLAEKDAALQQKDAACQAALVEKDVACKKVLEEKDRALKQKDESCAAALMAKQKACDEIIKEKDAALARKDADCQKLLHEKQEEIERLFAEKEKAFAEVVKGLREQFANLAAQTLKTQSVDLSQLNKDHLDAVLTPLKEQMSKLQDVTLKAQNASANLGESMSKDVDAIGKIAKELSGIASALSSDTRYQGRKGEEILAEKLRQAGLEENVNFFLQRGTDTDRPDAQVCDTENRWLIIDSKVSLTSYLEYMEAKDESVRQEKLAAHVASVRGKIDQLAKKKYPKAFGEEHKDRDYLPVTAMFVPYEAPLMEALRAEPSLWQFALENNVILITPLTLLAYIRLVYLAWQHEKEARNQQEIVNTARELLSRTNNFLKTFEEIGDAIASLSGTYEKAKSIVVDAPHAHTIANSANKLISLHVKLESKKGKKIEKAECLKDMDDDVMRPPLQIANEEVSVSDDSTKVIVE